MAHNKKGRMVYVPAVVIDEIEDILREDQINCKHKRVVGFYKLIDYARSGRELKRLRMLDFSKAMPRVPIDKYIKNKKVKRFLGT